MATRGKKNTVRHHVESDVNSGHHKDHAHKPEIDQHKNQKPVKKGRKTTVGNNIKSNLVGLSLLFVIVAALAGVNFANVGVVKNVVLKVVPNALKITEAVNLKSVAVWNRSAVWSVAQNVDNVKTAQVLNKVTVQKAVLKDAVQVNWVNEGVDASWSEGTEASWKVYSVVERVGLVS